MVLAIRLWFSWLTICLAMTLHTIRHYHHRLSFKELVIKHMTTCRINIKFTIRTQFSLQRPCLHIYMWGSTTSGCSHSHMWGSTASRCSHIYMWGSTILWCSHGYMWGSTTSGCSHIYMWGWTNFGCSHSHMWGSTTPGCSHSHMWGSTTSGCSHSHIWGLTTSGCSHSDMWGSRALFTQKYVRINDLAHIVICKGQRSRDAHSHMWG